VIGGNVEHHRSRAELARTVAGPDGRFAVRVTGEPGSFAISARLPGWGPVRTDPFGGGAASVAPGTSVLLTLQRGPSVRGRVTSALGLPMAGARVESARRTPPVPSGSGVSARAPTGST